jgi:uncharacterized membrane protein
MEHLVNFFGRFHPLFVHLPIGSIILAFIFDALSLFKRYRRLRVAVQPALLFGALSALLSVATGFSIAQEGGYENQTLTYHQYAGITTTLFSFLLLYVRRSRSILDLERRMQKPVRFYFFIPLIVLLAVTGHWGGSLTHGEEFITEFSLYAAQPKADPISKIQFIAQPNEAVLYTDVIQPIFESKCYSCHSSAKQKGDLRLDDPKLILQGGKTGRVIHAGVADSSTLFSRTMLPLEDDDHMPPNEKPQPTSTELDLIRLWLNEGASFDAKIKNLRQSNKAIQSINLLIGSIQSKTWIPKEEVSKASDKSLQNLKGLGAIVLPVAENSNYLHINFTNTRSLSPRAMESLADVKDQIVSLRFSYCTFENPDLKFLNNLDNLTWLFLDHTNVSDTSFQSVNEFRNLKYLNVVFTSVSNQPFLETKFPALEQAFVFQSNVTKEGIDNILQKHPSIKIDTGGLTLPKLASDTIIYKKKI